MPSDNGSGKGAGNGFNGYDAIYTHEQFQLVGWVEERNPASLEARGMDAEG